MEIDYCLIEIFTKFEALSNYITFGCKEIMCLNYPDSHVFAQTLTDCDLLIIVLYY